MDGRKEVDLKVDRKMALKELEQLTGELHDLAQLLRQETRTQARWLILQRVQEIISRIGEGIRE